MKRGRKTQNKGQLLFHALGISSYFPFRIQSELCHQFIKLILIKGFIDHRIVFLHIKERRGSLYTLTIRGEKDETLQKFDSLETIFCEVLPLTLEEIFISETEVVGYDIKKLILEIHRTADIFARTILMPKLKQNIKKLLKFI